jgi:hypothetical protein
VDGAVALHQGQVFRRSAGGLSDLAKVDDLLFEMHRL